MGSFLLICIIIVGIIVKIVTTSKKMAAKGMYEHQVEANPWEHDQSGSDSSETRSYEEQSQEQVVNYDELSIQEVLKRRNSQNNSQLYGATKGRKRIEAVSQLIEEESDQDSKEGRISDDFDLRKAVIYAEILNPKYKS